MIVNRRRFISAAPALILAPSLLLPREAKAAMHGSAPASINGLKINLSFDTSPAWSTSPAWYQTGIITAANAIQAACPNTNVTVNIEVGYTEIENTPPGTIAPSSSGSSDINTVSVAYSTIRAAMVANNHSASMAALLANTPAGSTLNGQTNFLLSSATCKALGLFGLSGGPISSTDPTLDGAIGIGTGWSSAKVVGLFLHEISHCLGRIVRRAPFVFSRFTGVGTRDFNATTSNTYFSLDGGTTDLADYDFSQDWADFKNGGVQDTGGNQDSFDAQQGASPIESLTTVDLQLLNAMGFQ